LPQMIVDFRTAKTVSRNYLKAKLEEQAQGILLLSPYREHLSQAFGRYFMRVGLPINIVAE